MSMAKIEDGHIVIRIPVDAVINGAAHAFDAAYGLNKYKVTDAAVFARELCHELNREEENGDTPVHRMLDKACLEALESGADGIDG